MATPRHPSRQVGAILAVLLVLGAAAFVRAADTPRVTSKNADVARLSAEQQKILRLNEITGATPIQGEVLALVAKPARTRQLLRTALEMTKQKPQPLNCNTTLILASAAENLKEMDASEKFYLLHRDQSLKLLSGQGLLQSYGGLIQLYFDNRKYAKCEQACREFLGIDGDEDIAKYKPLVLRRLILCVAKQGQFEKARELADKIIKAQPNNWLNQEIKGVVLHEEGKIDQAIKIFQDIIAQIKKDERLEKDEREKLANTYRYQLSGLYLEENEVDKAVAELKELLAKQPDNPTYNNDLGYVWADHGMNLDESERLIRKAIADDVKQRRKANPKLAPEKIKPNAAYLDSLGWVLFKEKKYREAREYLQQAVTDKEGQHAEIYDHLGDVCLALGDKSAACAAWKKALDASSDSRRERQRKTEVEKKLKAHAE